MNEFKTQIKKLKIRLTILNVSFIIFTAIVSIVDLVAGFPFNWKEPLQLLLLLIIAGNVMATIWWVDLITFSHKERIRRFNQLTEDITD